jgi:hypothetical protein
MLRSLAIFVPAVALVGCVASNNSDAPMVVLQNTALAAGITTCTFTGIAGQPALSHGEISTLSSTPYLLTPLIESRVTAVMGSELQHTILIEGADVHLSVPTATITSATGTNTTVPITLTGADQAFQSLFSGSIAPNDGTANATMNLIPSSTIASIVTQAKAGATDHLHAEVVGNITVYGQLGGDRVESLPFQYAVTVCNDCVVDVIGTCPITGTVRIGNPCNLFQDAPVDCCTEPTTGNLTCPARSQ